MSASVVRDPARAVGGARFGSAPRVLISSPIGFAIVVAATIAAVALTGLPLLAEASAAELAAVRWPLALRNTAMLGALAWGTVGVALMARRLRAHEGPARPLAVAALVACAASALGGVGQLVLPLVAGDFAEPRFGETAGYALYLGSSVLGVDAAGVAVALTALAARAVGVRRRGMLVLALVATAYASVDLVTTGGLPPFGVALLWLALGLLAREPRRTAAGSTLPA